MNICLVTGTVTSTAKHAAYVGHKLLAVQPLDAAGRPAGEEYLAVDQVQAGIGDRVLVVSEGNSVRQLLGGQPPIRSIIVGVVDEVTLTEEEE